MRVSAKRPIVASDGLDERFNSLADDIMEVKA
jgi:hypothetical protein